MRTMVDQTYGISELHPEGVNSRILSTRLFIAPLWGWIQLGVTAFLFRGLFSIWARDVGRWLWRYHIYSDPYKVCDDISSVKHDFRFLTSWRFYCIWMHSLSISTSLLQIYFLSWQQLISTFTRKFRTRMTSCVFRSLTYSTFISCLIPRSIGCWFLPLGWRCLEPIHCFILDALCWCSVRHSSSHVLFHHRPSISSLITISSHIFACFLIHRKIYLLEIYKGEI